MPNKWCEWNQNRRTSNRNIGQFYQYETQEDKQANKRFMAALTYNLKKYFSLSPKKQNKVRVVSEIQAKVPTL
jgi:hypothetical protein